MVWQMLGKILVAKGLFGLKPMFAIFLLPKLGNIDTIWLAFGLLLRVVLVGSRNCLANVVPKFGITK